MNKIGTSTGIEATRQRLNTIDPGKQAFDKLLGQPGHDYGHGPVEGTVQELVNDVNSLIDVAADFAQFKDEILHRPF